MKPWFRWVLVLPAAIGAALGIQIVFVLLGFISQYTAGVTMPKSYIEFVNGIAGGAAFVWFGAKSAPSNRNGTAICLAILYCFFTAILLTISILVQMKAGFSIWSIWVTICTGTGIAGSVYSCFAFIKKEKAVRETHEKTVLNNPPTPVEKGGTGENERLAAEVKSLRDSLTTPFKKP